MKQKTIAIIPALNEEKTINSVLNGVKKYVDEIVVVDDGSTDNTAKIVEKSSAILIKNKTRLGYDKAINIGFKEASCRNPNILVTFDADGQHIPKDLEKILFPIKKKETSVVVGIRPYKQRIAEKIFARFSKRKIGVSDPLCGIKAYSWKAYNKVGYFDKINSIGTELMFNCYKNGYKIKELNIQMNKRIDKPRFGSIIKGNYKIFLAFIKVYIKFRSI